MGKRIGGARDRIRDESGSRGGVWTRQFGDFAMGDSCQLLSLCTTEMASLRRALAIAEHLASSDRSNTNWQRDLSVAYQKVGDVLVAQGKLDEALQGYGLNLSTAERLAASDRSNIEWQRDLENSYNKVGHVLVAQGKLDEALQSYWRNLAIAERLAAADPSDTEWQRDLSVSYTNVGNGGSVKGNHDLGPPKVPAGCRHHASTSLPPIAAMRNGAMIWTT